MAESTTTTSASDGKSTQPTAVGSFSQQTARLRNQLRNFSSRSDVAAVLLKSVRPVFSAAVARLDFRSGERTHVTLDIFPSMPQDLAGKFSEKWLGPLALEVQTDTDHSARSRVYERDGQSVFVASAPLLDQASGLPDGAITMVIMGRPDDGEVLLTRLDTLATITSLRLSELASNRFGLTPSPIAPATSATSAHIPDDSWRTTGSEPSAGAPGANSETPVLQASPAAIPIIAPEPIIATAAIVARGPELNPATFGKMATHTSPREFGYSIVNSLANQSGAEQVSFGLVSGQRIQVLAISGLSDFKTSSPGVALMTQAMEECLDFGSLVVFPVCSGNEGPLLPIHRRWSNESGGAHVCSVPLADAGGTVAVVSIRRSMSKPFLKEELSAITRTLQQYGTALRVLERATRPLQQQVRVAAQESFQKSFGAGSSGRVAMLTVAAMAIIWMAFGTLTYRPLCTARVVAENMTQMTAPADAKLLKTYVQPGQEVKAGQLLAEFDTSEMTLQLQSLDREIASAEVEVRRGISVRDTSSAALHKARVGVLMTQAAALQERISRAKLTAPQDGIVIRADLEKRIGQVFSPGEPVLEFAPVGGWTLEIQVPDDIGTLVQPAQVGTFAAASYSSHSLPFEIQFVGGTAQVVDGHNVFLAQAPLAERPDWMKSGMEGTARISTVEKPVWWVLAHRIVDWCRMSFWI